MPEHYNLTIGFKGGSSETRLRTEVENAPKTCYEVVFADIHVISPSFTGGTDHPDPDKKTEWSTSGYSLARMHLSLADAFKQIDGISNPNITKRCLCIPQPLPPESVLAFRADRFGTPKWHREHTEWSTNGILYSYMHLRKVCRPCPTQQCPCVGAKNIRILVTDKTLVHTLSNGSRIKIKNPGHYKDVVEQVVKAELAIKLTCFPITE